jgi:hypothetical protein
MCCPHKYKVIPTGCSSIIIELGFYSNYMFLFGEFGLFVCMFVSFRKRNCYDWTRFRAISRLDKKFDDTMTEYYKAFCAMCKRVCGLKLTEEEGEHKYCRLWDRGGAGVPGGTKS